MSMISPQTSPINIGEQVVFQLGKERVRGIIIEYRGPIGIGGRKIYRIKIKDEGFDAEESAREVELPEEELTAVSTD